MAWQRGQKYRHGRPPFSGAEQTRLLARIGHWRVGVRWYAFAVGYFAVIKLGAALVHRIVTDEWPRFGDTPVALIFLGIAVFTWWQLAFLYGKTDRSLLLTLFSPGGC